MAEEYRDIIRGEIEEIKEKAFQRTLEVNVVRPKQLVKWQLPITNYRLPT